MADILRTRVVPSPDAAESAVGDETVILHLKSGTYFGLDPMGTRIWSMLKQGLSPTEICTRLVEEFGVGLDRIEADVRCFFTDLKANDILIDG